MAGGRGGVVRGGTDLSLSRYRTPPRLHELNDASRLFWIVQPPLLLLRRGARYGRGSEEVLCPAGSVLTESVLWAAHRSAAHGSEQDSRSCCCCPAPGSAAFLAVGTARSESPFPGIFVFQGMALSVP